MGLNKQPGVIKEITFGQVDVHGDPFYLSEPRSKWPLPPRCQ